MSEEELHEWIQVMSKGNKAVFQVVYDQSIDHVFRTVSFLVNNKQDVNNVVSEGNQNGFLSRIKLHES